MTATHRSVIRTTRHKTRWGLALLLPMTIALADPPQPLPLEPHDAPDPRWLEQLPPVSLPLPKPQDIASNRATAMPPAQKNPESRPPHAQELASSAESAPITELNSQTIAPTAPVTETPTEPATPRESEPSPETQTELREMASAEPVAGTETLAEPGTKPESEPSPEAQTEPREMASAEPVTEALAEPGTKPASEPSPETQTELREMASAEPVTEAPTEPVVESEPDVQASAAAEATSPPETSEIEGENVATPAPQTAPEVAAQAVPREPAPLAEQTEPGAERGPKSAAKPTPAYRWHVQLLAGRSLEKVEIDRERFIQHYGTRLKGLTLTISQSRYGDARDAFHRLRAEEWTDEVEARRWCAQLRTQGHQCLVTRVTRPDEPARGTPE